MGNAGGEILRAKARRTDGGGMGANQACRTDGGGMGANQARRTDEGGMGANQARRTDEGGMGANQARRTDEGGQARCADRGDMAANQARRTDEGVQARRADGGGRPFRKSLRNANINYRSGWFFVTSQVARNKSIFGAIVGDKVVLNELGQKVWEYWQGLPEKYPELEIFESVLMPNHFHALIRIHYRATNREQHLGFLMSRFKGGSGFIYGKMRRAGLVEDIGAHLWQFDYWDDLVTSDGEFAAQARYIRANPANWSRDRYGACTGYSFGNLDLLNGPRIAFVASQGFYASELRPRKIWEAREKMRAKARRTDEECMGANQARRTDEECMGADRARRIDEECVGANQARRIDEGVESSLSMRAASAANTPILISTFTSAQEREALRCALAKGKRVIQVIPQGIPPEGELAPELAAACREGRALLLSPQQSGSRLNKKVATWCNEYVLRHADEIWVGDISPNGMLRAMIAGLKIGQCKQGDTK